MARRLWQSAQCFDSLLPWTGSLRLLVWTSDTLTPVWSTYGPRESAEVNVSISAISEDFQVRQGTQLEVIWLDTKNQKRLTEGRKTTTLYTPPVLPVDDKFKGFQFLMFTSNYAEEWQSSSSFSASCVFVVFVLRAPEIAQGAIVCAFRKCWVICDLMEVVMSSKPWCQHTPEKRGVCPFRCAGGRAVPCQGTHPKTPNRFTKGVVTILLLQPSKPGQV